MSDSHHKAVFLSYASQDAEAARRIAESLRAAGVEVWFDQNELVGGDAWDAKIRKQIQSCALFVPIISANTQARAEGYFRFEWKLAVDRSHLMADDTAFLFPMVIGDITDDDARVPDKFREVQWTRLADDEDVSAAFCEHLKEILTREATSPHARTAGPPPAAHRPAKTTRAAHRGLIGLAVLAVAVVVALSIWRPWRTGAPGAATQLNAATTPAGSEAASLARQARPHYQGIFTRADLAIAEDLGRRAAEMEPTLARAWAVRAGAEACHLMRGFVAGEAAQQRAGNAQMFAQRALALDKDEPEALIALGQVAMFQGAPGQAEAFYRRVLALEPDNRFARRYLSIVLRENGRVSDAIGLMQDAVQRAPDDVLTRFDLAVAYAYGWDWPRAWEEADAALALHPFPGAQMLKVRLAFQWKGDLALMRRLLEEVDVTYRGEDDAVLWEMRCGLFERRPDRVLEASGRTARTYLEESFIFPGPKAWFPALAYQFAGKDGLARQQWQAAESVLRERLQADPQNMELRLKLAVTLAWLRQTEAARGELAEIEAAWREQLNPDRAWDLASFYAAGGDAAAAVPLVRMALHAGTGIAPLTVNHLRFDPWWDPIRQSPEFMELMSNPPPQPPPVKAADSY